MAITVTTDQTFRDIKVDLFKSDGTAATADGPAFWASSDETVLIALPDADGLTGEVRTVAPGGPARVTITVDVDLGSGVKTLTGVSEDVTVTPGTAEQASVIKFSFGEPSNKTLEGGGA